MIKAIVMDMDGTLLDPHNNILPETKQALLELEKQGVCLVLASGRSYMRLVPYAKELLMDQYGGMLLEVDGIATYSMIDHSRHIYRQMDLEEIRDVFMYLMDLECESMAVFDDGLFDYFPESLRSIKVELRKTMNVPEDFPWTAGPWAWLADMRDGYPKITYIKDVNEIHGKINKIQLMQEEDKIALIYQDLMEKFSDSFEIFRTCPRQLEILPKGYDKGKTLCRIMKDRGWSKDEVLVFGDGENDLSMFEVVEHSFAMGQAKDFVKEKAKYVTKSNVEQGILEALKKFELIK